MPKDTTWGDNGDTKLKEYLTCLQHVLTPNDVEVTVSVGKDADVKRIMSPHVDHILTD